MKTCSYCKSTKPLTEFRPDPRYRQGVSAWCKECKNLHSRRSYDPDKQLARKLKAKYGLTIEERRAMGNVCFACGSEKEPHVDHDHETGVVRGILCGPCNRILGLAHDDVDRLQALIDYLRAVDSRLEA